MVSVHPLQNHRSNVARVSIDGKWQMSEKKKENQD